MQTQLSLDVAAGDEHVAVTAVGEIDLSNIGTFKQALADAAGEATRTQLPLTVDLSEVGYLDSAAINALYSAADEIAAIIAPRLLMSTLSVSGLAEVISIDSVDDHFQ
jgi:anti-anti-sigma factor